MDAERSLQTDQVTVATFAVIFDFDGTVLDSESAEYHSHRQYFAEHGVELTEDVWCTGIGRVQAETVWWDWLCSRTTTPPTYERFRKTTRTYFVQHLKMEPMPGIQTLVDSLVMARVPRAIASAASSSWVARALRELHIGPAFEVIVTGDQVARTKPAPDVYLEAARRLGIEPAHCVAIEDSEPGLTAARAAGMHTVAIPHHLNRLIHDFGHADLELVSAADLTLDRIRELAGVR